MSASSHLRYRQLTPDPGATGGNDDLSLHTTQILETLAHEYIHKQVRGFLQARVAGGLTKETRLTETFIALAAMIPAHTTYLGT